MAKDVSRAFAMAAITAKLGFALPVVKSDKKEIETPDNSESRVFVIFRSSSKRRMFVKKIKLYMLSR
jgi:hypothetical protein